MTRPFPSRIVKPTKATHEHTFEWDDRTAYWRCTVCRAIRRRCYHCRAPLGVYPRHQRHTSVAFCKEECQTAFDQATRPARWSFTR